MLFSANVCDGLISRCLNSASKSTKMCTLKSWTLNFWEVLKSALEIEKLKKMVIKSAKKCFGKKTNALWDLGL